MTEVCIEKGVTPHHPHQSHIVSAPSLIHTYTFRIKAPISYKAMDVMYACPAERIDDVVIRMTVIDAPGAFMAAPGLSLTSEPPSPDATPMPDAWTTHTTTDTPTPWTSAVPEPATWLCMWLGFVFIGTILRRSRHGLA